LSANTHGAASMSPNGSINKWFNLLIQKSAASLFVILSFGSGMVD
jgi:hypothetical protein